MKMHFGSNRSATSAWRGEVARRMIDGKKDVANMSDIGPSPGTIRAFLNWMVSEGHATKQYVPASFGPVCFIGNEAHNEYVLTESGRVWVSGELAKLAEPH